MKSEKDHIDDLVTLLKTKKGELEALGLKIKESAKQHVVLFIDLSDSTQIKQEMEPEEWLGYIYEFVQLIDSQVKKTKGEVVKRIGDELMIMFSSTQDSEIFIDSLISDKSLMTYRFKAAIDFGESFFFKFEEHLSSDPYGPVIDRCARIAKLAGPGALLCSADYRNNITDKDNYVLAGSFTLKGFGEPQSIFVRRITKELPDIYTQPLIKQLDRSVEDDSGFRYMPRKFSPEFFRSLSISEARPFIASELLNVPKLPYSAHELETMIQESSNSIQKAKSYIGYLVDWKGIYDSYEKKTECLKVTLKVKKNIMHKIIDLILPLTMHEIIKELKKGQMIRARGIITEIFLGFELNYVELEVLND